MEEFDKIVDICKILHEGKAENIVYINTTKNSNIVNFFILATGSSVVHVKSLIDRCYDQITSKNIFNVNFREGFNTSKWQVLDAEEGFIHVFTKEEREKYNIEKLLSEGGNTYSYEKLLKKKDKLEKENKNKEKILKQKLNTKNKLLKEKSDTKKRNKINKELSKINKGKK